MFLRPISTVVCLLIAAQPLLAQTDSTGLIAPGAALQKVSGQFAFTEGPAVDKKGNIYFTDQPNDKIWLYDTEGKLSMFMDKAGRSNGLYIDRKGNILSCADEKNELWRIHPKTKKVEVLLTDYEGKKHNGPNDLWPDRKGGIYFTDPFYPRPWWSHKTPFLTAQNVYYLPKGAKQAVLVATDLKQPNGIVGTPDGRYLYVADIRDSKTYKYTINPDGTLSDRQLFAAQGSDGITLDKRGNLYLTGRGVTVYDPSGKKLTNIPVPAGWTANVCFGGKDRKTLFITASESVFVLPMQVQGVE
ncbi:SMP-30/gluconolactonase/LRE family protein [Rudanella paleaurantiibacter]|uniref:SMP-30/gluconolactonase/LRE family protein n=1 Tax=Rudanella paleaurantiibacter TaxID=2614655 RepID=A0A7J5TXF3_9BACT|nr:SMP-30/gluconolactonase/LRE family protein [Rudanella paleaurantiibacter]KAB7729324.1 SMP-30/gluconolactonase/LRE family protein [Rudanella paleaurantiibacter]